MQIEGKHSGKASASHTETSLKFGISISRREIHWNFCMILFPVPCAAMFAWSRVRNRFIRLRLSLATESYKPANNSDTGLPYTSWQASAVRKDGCRALRSYLERSDLFFRRIRKETSLWLSPECLR
jgi:hypothetical protein